MTEKEQEITKEPVAERLSATGTDAGNKSVQPSEAGVPEPEPESEEAHRPTEAEQSSLSAFCERATLVLCGYAESMNALAKTWKRMAAEATIVKRAIDGKTFPEIIDALMADDDIPDTFVYVPAYCFPTHPVGLADLLAYRIRKKLLNGNTGAMETVNDTGLPVLLHAKFVLQAQEKLGETYTEEEFFASYNAIAHAGELPEEIGMTFGNTVAYVVKQPSCMARLAEVLVCKRFICTNAVGFPFIEARLKLLYGKR